LQASFTSLGHSLPDTGAPAVVDLSKKNTTEFPQALSIFYTGTIGSGALSPVIFGRVGDAVGLVPALIVVAAVALFTLPLAALLRPTLRRV